MAINQKIKILQAHGIPYFVSNSNRLYADCMEAFPELVDEYEDVTDWSRAELYAWLGY